MNVSPLQTGQGKGFFIDAQVALSYPFLHLNPEVLRITTPQWVVSCGPAVAPDTQLSVSLPVAVLNIP